MNKKKKTTRFTKYQRVGIYEQILDEEYGHDIDGLTNQEILEMSALLSFIGKNRNEELEE